MTKVSCLVGTYLEVTDVDLAVCQQAEGVLSPPPRPAVGNGWFLWIATRSIQSWATIKQTTKVGQIGGSAKVTTAKPNPYATDPKTKVICVYTYDWTDEADVCRIRSELRALGITQKIPYKADADTLRDKYRVTGHRRISKYYE
ncbi:MAG: putative phosphothreonine lyase domain-containing protein [Candidatus Heimdallarchaeota archaeon]